jgi:RNA polymerase sigma-70 factor (ECF subfamily)
LQAIGTIGEAAIPRGQATTMSFEQLVAVHEPGVRRLAYRLLGWRDSHVDDVVQDVFMIALKELDRFRGESNIATWLAAVTLNRCRTHRRRQLLKLKWFARREVQTASDAPAMQDETSARVRAAVQALSPRDREVIVLFHLEELTAAEIAKLLATTNNAVEVRLHRARQKLKAKLADLAVD